MENLTIRFFPNLGKRQTRTGKIPLYCRMVQGRKKKEVRLNKAFDLDNQQLALWNEITQRVQLRDSDINDYLNSIEVDFKSQITTARFKQQTYSLEEIANVLFKNKYADPKKDTKDVRIIDYADKFLKEVIETPIRKEGTKKNYRNAIRQLKLYLKYSGSENLKICDFTKEHAEGFKRYLEDEIDPQKRKGEFAKKERNQEVSSSTKVKNVRPVFMKAVADGLLKENPFKKVKLNFRTPPAASLNSNQLRDFYNLDISKKPELEFAKDIFLFMCFTGLSICDSLGLSTAELKTDANGRIQIDTTRNKTKKSIQQVMVKPAQNILEKYSNLIGAAFMDMKIFPKVSDVDINRKLKLLCVMAKIPFSISTKTARITCREMLYEANVTNQMLVDCFMGWSTKDRIQTQYFKVTDEKLLETTALFEVYLHKAIHTPEELNKNIINKLNQLKWNS